MLVLSEDLLGDVSSIVEMHPHCEETVKKSRADRRIGILGFKQHVGNKYSAARAFGSFGDPKEQRNTVVASARFAEKYGLAKPVSASGRTGGGAMRRRKYFCQARLPTAISFT